MKTEEDNIEHTSIVNISEMTDSEVEAEEKLTLRHILLIVEMITISLSASMLL